MKPVIIYTQPDCPSCEITKLYLKDRGVEYIEKNVKKDEKYLNELTKHYKSYSTPTVVVGDKVITGFNLNEIDSVLSRDKG